MIGYKKEHCMKRSVRSFVIAPQVQYSTVCTICCQYKKWGKCTTAKFFCTGIWCWFSAVTSVLTPKFVIQNYVPST